MIRRFFNRKKPIVKDEIKEPKRVKRAIKKLHNMIDLLDFYMGHRIEFREIIKDASEIENLLHELALDKKIDHIRLAQKLKYIWESHSKKEKD